MTFTEWMILALVCLAGASSPGPSLALLLRTVIMHGRKAGMVFGLAHGLGIFFYAFFLVKGLFEKIYKVLQSLCMHLKIKF